jgi:hypothetical protein
MSTHPGPLSKGASAADGAFDIFPLDRRLDCEPKFQTPRRWELIDDHGTGAQHDVASDVSGNGDGRAVKAVTVADRLGTPPGDETTAAGDQTTTAPNRASGLTDGTRGLRGFWPGGAVVEPVRAVGGFRHGVTQASVCSKRSFQSSRLREMNFSANSLRSSGHSEGERR